MTAPSDLRISHNTDASWNLLAAPARPDVSIWLVHLGTPRDLAQTHLLCPEEQERLSRIRVPDAAWVYASSHVALRILIGRALGVAPASVSFRYPGDGMQAPLLREAQRLWPSLSHSGTFAAIALRRSGPVGVDIEPTRRAPETESVAQQFLSPREIAGLEHLAQPQRSLHMLALWCAKEAVLKAAGTGFSIDPREVVFCPPVAPTIVQLDGPFYVHALDHPQHHGLTGAVATGDRAPHGTLTATDLRWLLHQRQVRTVSATSAETTRRPWARLARNLSADPWRWARR